MYEKKLKSPNVELISEIVKKIEQKYGRLKPLLVVANTQSKENLEEITNFVEKGKHLRYVFFLIFNYR